MIIYEYPLNERVRTLLRLEDLYDKARHFCGRDSGPDHQVALVTMFEILEVAGRADLKSDLLQELDRQRATLEGLRANPAVAQDALDEVIEDIERSHEALLAMPGKTGQHLRENEWLMAIKQRTSIPGGLCEFDLPSFHFWLHQDVTERRQHLADWLGPMLPIADGLSIVLRLLRESARPTRLVAQRGVFQQMPAGKLAQMLRLGVAHSFECVPEISANKYALNIRFITPETSQRPRPIDQDVEFQLTFCNI